jgi:ribokinase/sulfofructose kinase
MSDFDVVTVGSALVDRLLAVTNLPEPDGGAFVRERSTAVGGVAANVAAAVSRLGCDAGVVARVGDDGDGDRVLADLRDRGIDATRVRRGDERTSYALVLRDPDGRRMIVAGGQSVRNFRLGDADLAYIRRADAAFTSAYAPDPVVADLAGAAADGDLPPFAFDLSGPLSELDGRGASRDTIDEVLPVCDLFVANEVAARSYLDRDPRAAVAALRDRGVRRAAVTRGADGALLLDGDDVVSVPAVDVAATDTTGAGDAFTAGLLHAWVLDGRPPAEAGRFAATAAAVNCTAEGARGALPTRAEVAALLD